MLNLPTPALPESPQEPLQEFSPTVQTATPPQNPKHRGVKRVVLICGAIVVGVSTLCGLSYAAWTGYLPNPFFHRPTIDEVISALNNIDSAQTTLNIHIAREPKENTEEPLDLSLFQEADNQRAEDAFARTLHMIPSDLNLALSLASSFSLKENAENQETHITGTYTGNNVTANVDITTRTVEGISYIKPDAIPLPIPILDLQILNGKWIDILGKSTHKEVFTYETSSEKKETSSAIVDPRLEFLTLLKQGVEDGAVLFSVPTRGTEKNKNAWQVTITINGEKLRDTIITLGKERETRFPHVTAYTIFEDNFLKITAKERAKDIYRELFRHVQLSAIIEDTGTPLSFSFATRIAPKTNEDTFDNQQISLKGTLSFTNINSPITVTAPENPLTGEEAVALLTGKTPEEVNEKQQTGTIADLRTALTLYYNEHGTYPATLNELIGTQDNHKIVTNIPLDAFTQKPYPFARTEAGYTLSYEMPSLFQSTTRLPLTLAVEGTNTATNLFFSEEAAKVTDSDKDGILAYDEVVTYGTSDTNADTDNDGYTDKTEIETGYNPLGEGTITP